MHKYLIKYLLPALLIHKAFSGFSYGYIILSGVLSIIGLALIFNLHKGAHTVRSDKTVRVLFFYLLVLLISLIRSYINGLFELSPIITIIGTYLIFFFYFLYVKTNYKLDFVKAIFNGINIYIALNLVLFVIGVESNKSVILSDSFGRNTILGLFGIPFDRVLFPLSASIQSYGLVCGTTILYNTILFREEKKISQFVFLVISIASLIMTDARGQIFFLLILLIPVFFANKLFLKNQLFIITTYVFSVVYITLILYFVYLSLDIELLVRSGSTTILSGREIIWLEFISNYRPNLLQFLIGFGNDGHLISGISSHYSYIFSNWTNPESASVHNNTFQLLLDIGFIGLTQVYYISYLAIKNFRIKFQKYGKGKYLAPIFIINYLLLSGTTEGVMNPENNFAILLLIGLTISSLRNIDL